MYIYTVVQVTVRMSVAGDGDDSVARASSQKTGMMSVGDFLEKKSTSDKENLSLLQSHTHKHSDSKCLLTFTFKHGE